MPNMRTNRPVPWIEVRSSTPPLPVVVEKTGFHVMASLDTSTRYEVAHDLSHCSRTRWIVAVVPRST